MKISGFFFAQYFALAFLLPPGAQLFSQKMTTWKGGVPGMEQEWNCPKNWNDGNVPNEFSNVFIPDVTTTTSSMPVIQSGLVEVNALFIESNAVLTIGPAAELVVYETAEGVNHSTLKLQGKMLLPEKSAPKVSIKQARSMAEKW